MAVPVPDAFHGRLALDRLFQDLVAGIVCGFLAIVMAISFGNLLLVGELRQFTPLAVGMSLFATMVASAVSALTGASRGGVAIVQDIPIAAMAGMLSALAVGIAGGAGDPHTVVVTVLATAMLTTFLTGLAFLILGYFKLARLFRFVPFPVIGGFLAGTGWLILQGGIGVTLGEPVTIDSLGHLLGNDALLRCAVAAAIVAGIIWLKSRSGNTMIIPGAVLLVLLIYNMTVLIADIGPEALRAHGWLVPLPENGGLWPVLGLADIQDIDWPTVVSALPAMAGIAVVTIIALLMNATGIELDTGRDIDLDRELRSVGLQNLISGLGGGLPAYPSVSLSLLAWRLNGAGRLVGLTVSACVAAALFMGEFLLDIIPTPLLGSLLVWIGGLLVIQWLVRSYWQLPLREYLLIVLIFLVIAGVSFAWGILVGLIAAIILFVLEYGRIDTVRHILSGSDYQSNADMSEERREALQRHGGAILIIRLQGYLFFGTADRLRQRVIDEIKARRPDSIRFLIIDFHHVNGLDSSAVLSFLRLVQIAERERFVVVLTGAGADIHNRLQRGGICPNAHPVIRLETDIERGLTWCEAQLLNELEPGIGESERCALATLLRTIMDDDADIERLTGYFERIVASSGDALMRQGEASDDIYFVEAGRGVVLIDTRTDTLQLAKVGPGSIVGEVAFYLGRPRTASVIAEEPVIAWRFSRAALHRLQNDLPRVAFRFHEGVAAMLAARLTSTNRLVRFLVD